MDCQLSVRAELLFFLAAFKNHHTTLATIQKYIKTFSVQCDFDLLTFGIHTVSVLNWYSLSGRKKLLYISPVQLSLINKKSIKLFVVLASIDIIVSVNKSKQIHLQKQQCQLMIGCQMDFVVEQVIRSPLFGSFFFYISNFYKKWTQ